MEQPLFVCHFNFQIYVGYISLLNSRGVAWPAIPWRHCPQIDAIKKKKKIQPIRKNKALHKDLMPSLLMAMID